MSLAAEYLLAGAPAEVERLRIQACTWEPEVETMLDQMGIERGWRCIDVGCGSMGIIGPLARRVGCAGLIVGLDHDPSPIGSSSRLCRLGGVRKRGISAG